MFDALLPERSAEDLIGGIVRVRLGSAEYALPELPMDATDEWAASIDGSLSGLLDMIDRLGESADLAGLFTQARAFEAQLLDALVAYDRSGVLPDRSALRSTVTHTQVLFAVMGVWATTASPLGALVVGLVRSLPTTSGSSELAATSGSLASLAGIRSTSGDDSPMASSSTPSRTPSGDSTTSSSDPSKRRARATSSPTTRRRTGAGRAGRINGAASRSGSAAQLSSVR